eukprot:scaffold5321_cov366-Prasinococcus_capsulatus_cf.AAC.6
MASQRHGRDGQQQQLCQGNAAAHAAADEPGMKVPSGMPHLVREEEGNAARILEHPLRNGRVSVGLSTTANRAQGRCRALVARQATPLRCYRGLRGPAHLVWVGVAVEQIDRICDVVLQREMIPDTLERHSVAVA